MGEFDQKGSVGTKWGTKEDLLKAIKAASEKGIITYIDAVLNHKLAQSSLSVMVRLIRTSSRAGADDTEEFMATMVDENNRNKEVGEMHNIEGWTKCVFH